MVEVVDDGEDSVTGVVGVAGIEATSDSFNTVTEWNGEKKKKKRFILFLLIWHGFFMPRYAYQLDHFVP